MFGRHFEIHDGCLSLIKLTNIILTVAAETTAKELDFQFMKDMNASTDCRNTIGTTLRFVANKGIS